MRIKFYTLLLLYFISLFAENISAQEKTMFFMDIKPQNNLINPAFHSNKSYFVLSLSGFASFDNSSLTVNNLLTRKETNGVSDIYWDFETIDSKLRDQNYVNIGAGTTPLLLGLNLNKSWNFNFSVSIKNSAYIKYPRTISQLRFGNADIENDKPRTIDLNNYGINEISYTEYSFGLSKDLSPDFQTGVHFKVLTGISAIQTNRFLASIETTDDFSESLLETNILMNFSGPLFEADKLTNVFRQQISFGEFILGKGSSSFKNLGTAYDFGFSWNLNKKIKLHGSLNDLGAIRWREKPQRLVSKGEYLYDGVQFTPYNISDEDFSFKDYLQQYADTVLATVIPIDIEGDFKTQLYAKTYLGIAYDYSDKLSLNGLYQSIIYKDITLKRGTIGANFKFNNTISLAGSFSYSNFWLYNFGLGIQISNKRFQYYLVTDNINMIDVRNSRSLNLAFGINYWFRGKESHKE